MSTSNNVAVSVIVPTKESAASIEACLESLRGQTYSEVEVIVVDNHSRDRTQEIASRYADRVVERGPERSSQRNHGFKVAGGDVIVFIDSDMVLEPEVLAEAIDAFAASSDIGALVIPELSYGAGFWTACRSLEKELYLGEGSIEAARIFRRSVLEEVGGFDERLTALEDWDLDDRVRQAGWTIERTRALVWHDEGRIRLRDTMRKKRYYGQWFLDYAAKRHGGAARRISHLALLRRPLRLVRSPHLALGLFVLKLMEAAAFALGAVEARIGPAQ